MSSAHPDFQNFPKDLVHDSEMLEILRATKSDLPSVFTATTAAR